MKYWITGLLLMTAVPGLAQLALVDPGYRQNKTGNELYSSGKYEQAMGAYTRALSFRDRDDEIRYNLANSLLQMGRTEEAMKVYNDLLKKVPDGLKGPISYNAGNAMFEAQKYKEAAEYCRQALLADPKDRWAKENYELALKKLQEQQQQQQQQQNNEDQDKEKDKNQQPQPEDQQQNPDKQKPEQQPKPADRKKQQVERMLQALREQEKQDRKKNAKRKKAHVVDRSGKDW